MAIFRKTAQSQKNSQREEHYLNFAVNNFTTLYYFELYSSKLTKSWITVEYYNDTWNFFSLNNIVRKEIGTKLMNCILQFISYLMAYKQSKYIMIRWKCEILKLFLSRYSLCNKTIPWPQVLSFSGTSLETMLVFWGEEGRGISPSLNLIMTIP